MRKRLCTPSIVLDDDDQNVYLVVDDFWPQRPRLA